MAKSETPVLTFNDGKFIAHLLFNESDKISGDWARTNFGIYETTSLRAAAAFRRFADRSTEKIFERVFQARYSLPKLPPLPELDPHQREGLEWALTRKRSYLAHCAGAGKTAQAILAGHYSKGPGKTVVIVPPSLTLNWVKEINKVLSWTDDEWSYAGIVPKSSHRHELNRNADFIIVPDSMLAKSWVLEHLQSVGISCLIVDEASRFKEQTSERSLAFYGGSDGKKVFDGIFRDARHVIFLDGSPMPTRMMDLWAPTYALDPEAIDCMSREEFGFRYCGPKMNDRGQWEFKHSSNEVELRKRLQKDFMHVVTEERLDHPERLRSLLFMDKDVRTAQQKTWERRHLTKLDTADLDQGELAKYRRILGLRKTPWSAEYIQMRLEKGQAVLAFAYHRDVCEGLADLLSRYKPGVIMGGVSTSNRMTRIDKFQNAKTNLMVINIAAGSRGNNIQRAERGVFVEPSWSDEENKQCEHRYARRGSVLKQVRSDYIICPGSMDERLFGSIFTKQERVRKVIG